MRMILCGLGAMIATAALPSRADAAPIYRYCASYQDRGVVTCAYDTFQQCLATAGGGAGGTCSENPAWDPALAAPERPKKKHHKS